MLWFCTAYLNNDVAGTGWTININGEFGFPVLMDDNSNLLREENYYLHYEKEGRLVVIPNNIQ